MHKESPWYLKYLKKHTDVPSSLVMYSNQSQLIKPQPHKENCVQHIIRVRSIERNVVWCVIDFIMVKF